MEYAFYCCANGETFDGYLSAQEAEQGKARLTATGNFTENDFEETYLVKQEEG